MRNYTVQYVHKVSQTCGKCHRSKSEHSREPKADDPNEMVRYPYPGQRVWGEGGITWFGEVKCTGYEHETETHELPDELPTDRNAMAKVLRDHKIMGRGERLSQVRAGINGSTVCFPVASIWHSIIITLANPQETP
jgi:hypothetical protein